MFNWVVKVVPQPPEGGTDEAANTSAAKPQKSRDVKSPPLTNLEEGSEESQGQTGVLGWLSNGFVSALPQPSGSPRLERANSEARQPGEDGERSGVIGWVAQGLTKVLPQPDDKYKEADGTNNDEHTEVYDVETMPDYDPLPHIPVVEMESEDEVSEVESLNAQFPPNVVNWIKQMIPQPTILPPGAVPTEPSTKSSRSSLDKILSPPPESLSGISLDTDSKASGVVGWFVTGLGLKLPQPVPPQKDDAEGAAEVLQKVSSKLKPDMVLEDVESDNEGQQKCESHSKAAATSTSLAPPSPAAHQQQEVTQQTQSNSVESQKRSDAEAEPKPTEDESKTCQEDAETQTGRWTPFIESIKKEAEDVALATMEERLLQERVEMARMAEEVARQTAEMAIRQMASEGQSIKLSLGSQELLEEPEAEKEESVAQEEQKVETEEPVVQEPEPNEEAEQQPASPSPPPSPESVKKSEPDSAPEPEAKTQEASPEPVTQQPQKTEEAADTDKTADADKAANTDKAAEKEEEATGDGCGESSSLSLRPAVNVEDVDSDHEKGRAGGGGRGEEQILNSQDPKLTTLTVPVAPSGGRQSKGDKDKRLHSQSEDDDDEGNMPVRAWPSQSSLHSTDDVLKERPASSASQTSTVVNERLQELVRMFKERTEKAKEKLIDTDSSDEDSVIT